MSNIHDFINVLNAIIDERFPNTNRYIVGGGDFIKDAVMELREEDKKLSANYKYPHSYGGWVKQQYLPDELVGRTYYNPTDNCFEKRVKEIRKEKGMG